MESTTISEFRSDIKKYLDFVTNNNDELIINRGKGKAVVVISLEDYNSWQETNYLLTSKTNADRLRHSIAELENGKGLQKPLVLE